MEMKKMETLNKKIRVYLEVEDQDTGDIVDDTTCRVWGNPGQVLRVYVDDRVVHKQTIE